MKHPDPETPEEWQFAVDVSHTLLHMDSARKYGLIAGGPEINIERCEEVIKLAVIHHGITPHENAIERVLPGILNGTIEI